MKNIIVVKVHCTCSPILLSTYSLSSFTIFSSSCPGIFHALTTILDRRSARALGPAQVLCSTTLPSATTTPYASTRWYVLACLIFLFIVDSSVVSLLCQQ
ncbi:hypothetical protein BGW80DRAFT_1323035 [Lactifluus volemus]|nr:hypothetical protein BGW80DRAFT_1323035 [Lactifluus volemus]